MTVLILLGYDIWKKKPQEEIVYDNISLKPPYFREDELIGGLHVWIVDGSYIRGHIDEEFTNVGQHYRHLYIPVHELWIDQEAEHDEQKFFIEHLLMEHRLMAKGMSYDKALVEAEGV